MVAKAAFVGGSGLVLVGMAGDQRGVDVPEQTGHFPSAGFRRGYAGACLGCLQPGHFPGLSAGRAHAVQYVFVDGGQQSPGSRCRSNRAEHPALVAQHGQIRDGLAAISHHHREVGSDPARAMTSAAWPKRSQRSGVRPGQSGGIGEINQQPCPGRHARPPPHRRRRHEAWDVNRYPARRKCLPSGPTEPLDKVHRPSSEGTFALPLMTRPKAQVNAQVKPKVRLGGRTCPPPRSGIQSTTSTPARGARAPADLCRPGPGPRQPVSRHQAGDTLSFHTSPVGPWVAASTRTKILTPDSGTR